MIRSPRLARRSALLSAVYAGRCAHWG